MELEEQSGSGANQEGKDVIFSSLKSNKIGTNGFLFLFFFLSFRPPQHLQYSHEPLDGLWLSSRLQGNYRLCAGKTQ